MYHIDDPRGDSLSYADVFASDAAISSAYYSLASCYSIESVLSLWKIQLCHRIYAPLLLLKHVYQFYVSYCAVSKDQRDDAAFFDLHQQIDSQIQISDSIYDLLNNYPFIRNQMTAKTFILELLNAKSNVYGVHALAKQSSHSGQQDLASLEMS